jgi:integrase
MPGHGGLRVHELTVGTVHRFLRSVGTHHGPATAKMCRSVLSGMCALAARHDALDRNPVRDVGSISNGVKQRPRALSAAEARQLRALLTYDAKAVERELPDFVAMMLATGLRIGECAALTWKNIDLNAGTVTVQSTVVRLPGRGVTVKPTKSAAGIRTLGLPSWCMAMLRARPRTDPVFLAPMGGWQDPLNTQADLRGGVRRGRVRLDHLAHLPEDRGHADGPSRAVCQGGSRPTRPRPPIAHPRRLLRTRRRQPPAATVLESLG